MLFKDKSESDRLLGTIVFKNVLDILELTPLRISKHELTVFFRKPGHKQYRECKDQVLRNFLKGMQVKYRAEE